MRETTEQSHFFWNLCVSFDSSWTTRRRTLAGSLVSTTRPLSFGEISVVRLLLVERAQDTAHSVSTQLLHIPQKSFTDPCASLDVDRQQCDVRDTQQGKVPQAKGLCGRRRRVFSSDTDKSDRAVPTQTSTGYAIGTHLILRAHFYFLPKAPNTAPWPIVLRACGK